MVEFRWTKATLLFTVLPVVLALMSLLVPWYSCTMVTNSDGHVYVYDREFYLMGVESGNGITYYESSEFAEVGSLLMMVAALIVLWAFVSIAYISTVYDDEKGFYLGWVVVALSCAPIVIYTLFIQGAAEAGTSGSVESRLTLGPLIALFAAVLQTAAVVARNIQVLNPRLSARAVERAQEESGAGDLPER